MLNSTTANMYPWYRDSMSQLGQFCQSQTGGGSLAHNIKTENGAAYNSSAAAAADSCMLALDYAQNKVRRASCTRINSGLLFYRLIFTIERG